MFENERKNYSYYNPIFINVTEAFYIRKKYQKKTVKTHRRQKDTQKASLYLLLSFLKFSYFYNLSGEVDKQIILLNLSQKIEIPYFLLLPALIKILQQKIAVNLLKMQTICPKCQQQYSVKNPPKKLINCQHVLCLHCISNEILCPIDRKRLERRKYTIEAFQTHQQILDLLTNTKQQQKIVEKTKDEVPDNIDVNEQKNKLMKQNDEVEVQNNEQKKKVNQANHQEEIYQSVPVQQLKAQEAVFPKFEDINFETCLLHSKTADLICLKDKCLICSNCGLFGEHKNHDMLPYDMFVSSYTALIQQSYNNFELLKKSEQLLEVQALEDEIDIIIKQKREYQIKNVKKVIAGIIQTLKNSEKSFIAELDLTLKSKKQKILKQMQKSKLQTKVNQYYKQIQKLTQGSIDIFRLENIDQYIDYVDQNNSKSYFNKEEEYLIAEIQSYYKNLRKKFNEELSLIECKIKNNINELISNCFELYVQYNPSIVNAKYNQEVVKKVIEKIPLGNSGIINKLNEQDLLTNSCQNEQKEKKNLNSMSPIQPIPKFQQTFDTTFKNSYKQNIITGAGQEFFLRVKQVQIPNNQLFIPNHKKTISLVKTVNSSNGFKQSQQRKDIDCLPPNRYVGKPNNSNNSSHIVQRQILSVLNQNKKKKKLQLPQKYLKIYDQLQKDKLDILDFGGAGLGDQIMLSISELFQSRSKLKSAKLMNNKISDEIFPDLLFKCRHLCSINLSYNNLTEKSLEWLEKESDYLGNLSNITLSNNKIVLRNVKDRIQNLRKKGVKVSL